MTDLAGLQQAMMNHLLDGDQGVLSNLDKAMPSPELRLGIYANAYRERLLGVLDSDYEMLRQWMGQDGFRSVGLKYIREHPSSRPSLRHFGDRLGDMLDADGQAVESELCRFERMLLDVFDAADADQPTAEILVPVRASAWPFLKLRFHPAVRSFNSQWNTVSLWRALKSGETRPEPVKAQQSWVLWRNRARVSEFRSLSPFQFAAMSCFQRDFNLAETCVTLTEQFADVNVPGEVRDTMQSWFEAGMVSRIDVSELDISA